MKLKTKRIGKNSYKITVKDKTRGEIITAKGFIRKCEDCGRIFFTGDDVDFYCDKCKKEREEMYKRIDAGLDKLIKRIEEMERVSDKGIEDPDAHKAEETGKKHWVYNTVITKKEFDNINKKPKYDEPKDIVWNTVSKTEKPHRKENRRNMLKLIEKEPIKIIVPSFNEKLETLKRNGITVSAAGSGLLKIFELFARGYSFKEIIAKTGLKEASLTRYMSDLTRAGLVYKIRGEKTYKVNPAIKYELL